MSARFWLWHFGTVELAQTDAPESPCRRPWPRHWLLILTLAVLALLLIALAVAVTL